MSIEKLSPKPLPPVETSWLNEILIDQHKKINEIIDHLNSGAVGGEKCPICKGTGKNHCDNDCISCDGTGRVSKPKDKPVSNKIDNSANKLDKPSDGLEEVIRYVLRDTAEKPIVRTHAIAIASAIRRWIGERLPKYKDIELCDGTMDCRTGLDLHTEYNQAIKDVKKSLGV